MSFVKKVKQKVKNSLQIPSRSRTPDSRSSPGPTNRTPSQLSAASSSVSIPSPANPAGDPSIHAAVPQTLSAGASHNCPIATSPLLTPGQEVMAIPVVAVTGERIGGNTSWAGLKGFLGLLDRSADVFGPLRSAVDGIMTCVEIYERVGQGREEYESLRQELNSLFDELSQYFGGSALPGITSSFHNLTREIEKEMKVVEEKGQRSVIERVAEAHGDRDEVLECYRRVERLLQRIAINANVRVWKIVDEQMTEQRLRNLSPSLSARYSSAEAKTVGRAGCTSNTRIDVLKRLGDWAHGKDSEKIYWLNGMAGTGKTTIAYTLCDQLHKESKLAASFFCSRRLPECRNASLIFPTIAYQLARFSLPFRFSLSHAIERDPDVCAQQLSVQFQTLILEPLRAAKDGLPDDLVVTIDALDECENPDSVGQILDVLFPNALDLPVKFLITSRPEPQIRRRMLSRRGERTRFELHLHDLDRGLVKEDIKTYLGDELKEMRLASTDLERFADRSGALFIYAATLVRYLSFENFARGPDRLQLVLGAAVLSSEPIKQKREGTPGSSSEEEVDVTGRSEAEVIALYTAILKAAMEDPRLEKKEKVERRRVLHTVVCAQEPLTVGAISGLMGLSSSDSVQSALQPLLSVIRISEESGVVTTLHESFPNYLCNKHRSGEFHCDTAKHNGWLANRCFAVMKMPDPPFNICNLESSYAFDDEVENLEERIEESISRELVYSCRYWGAHLVAAEVSKRLVDGLSEFLETRFLLWMEVMNLKHSLSLGAGTLREILLWCKKAECSVEARELAVDGWDFVTMYSSSPIARSTPHIYVSGLPFWSKARPIAKQYVGQMRGLIGIGGTALGLRTSTLLATCKHKTPVFAVAYSPDGTRIASVSDDGVHVWDAYAGQIIHQAFGNDTSVTSSIAYSPNGTRIASGSYGGTVDLWDARTGQRIGEPLRGHANIVCSVVYSPDGTRIASGSADTTVRIWDAHTGESIGEPLRGHTDRVSSVAYSPDSTSIVSGSNDGTVRIWDARTGHMKGESLQGHTSGVLSVAYSPDGTRIVSGSSDKSLRIWNAHTGQGIGKPLHGHIAIVLLVGYSPDGSRIISSSYDHTVRIWDAHTGQSIGEPFLRHTHLLPSVAYSPDGARIVSGAYDCTLQIWDARTRENTGVTSMGHTSSIKSVRYSPDGTRILSCSRDNTLRIWDAHTGQMIGDPFMGHGHDIESVDYSPNGAYIVSGSIDGSIRIWDAHAGQTIGEPWAGHTDLVISVAYLPDGDRIVLFSGGDTVQIWDAVMGQSIGEPIREQNRIASVACSPDGARIISTSHSSYDLHVRDAHMGQIIGEPLSGHTGLVKSVAYSPDGAQIVTGSRDTTARIWNAHTGQVIGQPFQGHTDTIRSVSYSPDGARIVTASDDMTLRIWNAHTGQSVGEPLRGHTKRVNSVAYSPDGSRIVSGSSDCSVRIWDAYSQGPDVGGHHIHPPSTWTMDETGWVVDEKCNPLIWVPYDLQGVVLRHPNVAIISQQGALCIDLSTARVGELWRSCYKTSPSGFA